MEYEEGEDNGGFTAYEDEAHQELDRLLGSLDISNSMVYEQVGYNDDKLCLVPGDVDDLCNHAYFYGMGAWWIDRWISPPNPEDGCKIVGMTKPLHQENKQTLIGNTAVRKVNLVKLRIMRVSKNNNCATGKRIRSDRSGYWWTMPLCRLDRTVSL
jgi:hypothetical protein